MKCMVFVYGTLMKGHCNDHYLREERYIGIGKLRHYEMYHVASYPGIIESEGESVVGELYEIDEKLLKTLDQLEVEGDLYIRKRLPIVLDCQEIEAEVYVWNKPIDASMQKVTEMPWEPTAVEPCRCHLRPLDDKAPFKQASWPIIIQNDQGLFYEACTIRGSLAAVLGESYLDNTRYEEDWQQRVRYAMKEIVAKHVDLHVVIHDQEKGVIAENCSLGDEEAQRQFNEVTEFVHVESERAFLYSLVRLNNIQIFERVGERYFKDWTNDGNDPTLAKQVKGKVYRNISEYELEKLTKNTWDEID